jgi:V8-like Glu-specific endopeptidase
MRRLNLVIGAAAAFMQSTSFLAQASDVYSAQRVSEREKFERSVRRSLVMPLLIPRSAVMHNAVFHFKDRRVAVPHGKNDKLAPLGLLVNKTLGGQATAFLVGSCHILTAAHAVSA